MVPVHLAIDLGGYPHGRANRVLDARHIVIGFEWIEQAVLWISGQKKRERLSFELKALVDRLPVMICPRWSGMYAMACQRQAAG